MGERRTFSVDSDATRLGFTGYEDSKLFVVRADPVSTKTEAGERISIGFPVLLVSAIVSEPEKFAQRVAEVLSEHFDPEQPDPHASQVEGGDE